MILLRAYTDPLPSEVLPSEVFNDLYLLKIVRLFRKKSIAFYEFFDFYTAVLDFQHSISTPMQRGILLRMDTLCCDTGGQRLQFSYVCVVAFWKAESLQPVCRQKETGKYLILQPFCKRNGCFILA